jgi:NitT/TauT family transport system ATP-binding protein
VVEEVAIEAPYPRTEEFRTALLFNQYCRHISATLAAGSASSMGTPNSSRALSMEL